MKDITGNNKLKVLYIEDNEENKLLIKRVLQSEGFIVVDASDGVTGLEKVKSELPDIILMDLHIPGIDGYELTTYIKNDEKLKHIPVIAITASVMKRDREKAIYAGCDGYIEKPVDIDILPLQIRKFIEDKKNK